MNTDKGSLNIDVAPVFIANAEGLKNKKYRILCNQGGTRSGKTYNIIILLIILCLNNSGMEISIVSESVPHLKRGAIRDFLDIMDNMGIYSEKQHNKTDQRYMFPNKSWIEFFSADDSKKLRGAGRDICFINECDLLKYDSWVQLNMRTTQNMIIDYNPADQFHWIYDKLIPREDCLFIQSTYLDNYDFLKPEQIKEIERMKEDDPDYWQVYGLGNRGQARELIYNNYQIVDISQFPDHYDYVVYGLDFGYTNPSALLQVGIYDSKIYITQKIYKSGLTNDDLINEMRSLDIPQTTIIYGDTAEAKTIEEICRAGFNCKPSDKSVKDGIGYVRSQKLFIDNNSTELIKELRMYKYKTDKNGIVRDTEPVKMNDHLMDALRYALYTNYMDSNKPVPRIRYI